MEDNKYENILANLTFEQLVYERAILLNQYATIKEQLAKFDNECKRRINMNLKEN